jgi:UDP-N-acetylglucosamine 2-epimerase (non-hydrolysing)
LIGDDPAAIASLRPSGEPPAPCAIPLWDGHAAERVADVIADAFGSVGAMATSA